MKEAIAFRINRPPRQNRRNHGQEISRVHLAVTVNLYNYLNFFGNSCTVARQHGTTHALVLFVP